MEETLIYLDDVPCGSLRMEKRGLYTHFSACFGARKGQLYSLMLEGTQGRAVLGVPEWSDGCYFLRRTVANREFQQIGALCCARLTERAAAPEDAEEQGWMRLTHPEYFFHVLAPQLAERSDCYWRQEPDGRSLAVPMEEGRPFLLPRYFCFACVVQLFGRPYAVFSFDAQEQPRIT